MFLVPVERERNIPVGYIIDLLKNRDSMIRKGEKK